MQPTSIPTAEPIADDMVALEEVFKEVDGPVALARILKTALSAPSNWRARNAVPHEQGPNIELAVVGKVTVERLCPSARWVRIADEAWPHPEGRPLLDTVRPVASESEQKAA